MGYDRYPELLLDEKRALLEYLASCHGRLFYTHDPTTALSHVTLDEQGRFGSPNDKSSVRGVLV